MIRVITVIPPVLVNRFTVQVHTYQEGDGQVPVSAVDQDHQLWNHHLWVPRTLVPPTILSSGSPGID